MPVRERGGPRIIGVTEFYQLPDEIDAEVASARLGSWTVLALAALVSYLLLAGIVKGGSDMIERQQQALRRRVAELSSLLEQNAGLHDRLRRSAERTTALNESGLRRIGSDLHDGPAQTMALALLRLDELDAAGGVSEAIGSALDDLRSIAAGLRSPAFDDLSLADVAERAIREHERRTGKSISSTVASPLPVVPVVTKIATYRVLQEALSNATRHAAGAEVEVVIAATPRDVRLEVRDRGPGFDSGTIRSHALGVAGMRERAELLGGSFEIARRTDGPGTVVRLALPVNVGVQE